jgi:hypothetical protein
MLDSKRTEELLASAQIPDGKVASDLTSGAGSSASVGLNLLSSKNKDKKQVIFSRERSCSFSLKIREKSCSRILF